MSSSIVENAVKALTEFEAELDRIKNEAVDARRKLLKIAIEEGETAKKEALAKAQAAAEERIKKAKQEAERESVSVLAKGEESLRKLNGQISERTKQAVELVVKQLTGV